jgi:alpha-L-fucosidase
MTIVRRESADDPQLQWFPQRRFGMFVHFGIYALLGQGEWAQYERSIPRAEYQALAQRFDPADFDADAWVQLAQDAGCRYITFTVKHHDGFCLFDSALTDYKITNTPFGRDLTGELIAACQRRDMPIILYYSQPDWHHPNYVHLPGAFKDLNEPPPGQQPDWEQYRAYLHGQVQELCTQYGRIDGIWFDGSHKSEETWQGRQLYHMIKGYQPWAVVNERARYGDFFTPERSLPPEEVSGYLFECCQSVSQIDWGYSENVPQYSVPNLIESLVRVVSKGGNFLLNVGPTANGVVPAAQQQRMRAVGRWLDVHGEAVYGTQASWIDTGSSDVLTTRKGNDLYVLLCRWPEADRLTILGLDQCPESAFLLRGGVELTTRCTRAGLEIGDLPMLPSGPTVEAIALRFRQLAPRQPDKPVTSQRIVHLGRTVLPVTDAEAQGLGVKGQRLRVVEREPARRTDRAEPTRVITNWHAPEQKLVWSVDAPYAGTYRVSLWLACPEPYAGSTYALCGDLDALQAEVQPTPSFEDYAWQRAGVIELPRGPSRLTLAPVAMPYGYLFAHVAAIALEPAT